MPSNIINTQPTLVFPYMFTDAFEEVIERPAFIDQMTADGRMVRYPRTAARRCRFRLSRRLNEYEAAELRQWYDVLGVSGGVFWFYNPRELHPPDLSGANPVGRYAVVWDGPLSQSTEAAVNCSSDFAFREVQIG